MFVTVLHLALIAIGPQVKRRYYYYYYFYYYWMSPSPSFLHHQCAWLCLYSITYLFLTTAKREFLPGDNKKLLNQTELNYWFREVYTCPLIQNNISSDLWSLKFKSSWSTFTSHTFISTFQTQTLGNIANNGKPHRKTLHTLAKSCQENTAVGASSSSWVWC